jgi:Kef-type K+ transport system membrane component KefB
MMPRGEVGIIVALIGTKILVDNTSAVSPEMYAIIVLMCIATTIIAPPILSVLYSKKYKTQYNVTDDDRL